MPPVTKEQTYPPLDTTRFEVAGRVMMTVDVNGNAVPFGPGAPLNTSGAVTVADGADVAEGATTDLVIAAGAAGSISSKLRALSRDQGASAASLAALLVQFLPSAPSDRSGSITSGGTSQQLMAANANRRGFILQNTSTADLWFSDVGAAAGASPSMRLSANSYWETPPGWAPTGQVRIWGATTGQTFTGREW